MAIVTVTATKAFPYLGRDIQPGEAVEMPAVVAAVHGRRGNVSLCRQPRYATRDLSAESLAADIPEPPKRRRAYRRRDLVAESE